MDDADELLPLVTQEGVDFCLEITSCIMERLSSLETLKGGIVFNMRSPQLVVLTLDGLTD